MKHKDEIDAIAFDAFGTLCKVTSPRKAFAILFQRLGLSSPELGHAAMTVNLDFQSLARLFAKDKKLNVDDLQKLLQEELDSIRLYPETIEVLEDLRTKGYQLAVISNLAKPYGDPLKRLLGSYIDEFVWSFEVAVAKPDREIFATLCKRLGCRPMRVLMVGDTWESDVMGGMHYGMPTIFIDRQKKSDPDLGSIHSLLDLTELPQRRFVWK
ncbi:MAG: HAD family hydrolase [Candidatus Methylumidiphilus sp.]